MAEILDGRALAEKIRKEVKAEVKRLRINEFVKTRS
jgi:5,10-methylene-tetrahydrofolate dehydrogenase/methenyl tetrahydrofolate cyclohydrolase